MSFASDFTQFSEFRHISQHSARNLCKMADLAIFPTRICDGTLCRRAGCPHPAAQGKRIPTPVTAGHTGPALQGAAVIQGGQSRPPLQSSTSTVGIGTAGTPSSTGQQERDGENAVPCIIFTAYSAWPLCFMTDTTSSTQARQRASSGASTMTRSSGSVPDSRTRIRPVSPRRRATLSTAFCTAGS